jgi:guanylate kinase
MNPINDPKPTSPISAGPENESLSFDVLKPKPLLVVISGPSGVGKDAVLKEMQAHDLPFHFVVTMTSRAPRKNEIDGKDYFFTTRENFEEMIRRDEFIEYALVYEDYKGVPKPQIRAALSSGMDVVLRVDVQGAATLRSLCPGALLIFLIPDNEKEWLKRLNSRQTETVESLAVRVNTARSELERMAGFDYVVVNAHDRLHEAVETIMNIIDAEHHRVQPREICL